MTYSSYGSDLVGVGVRVWAVSVAFRGHGAVMLRRSGGHSLYVQNAPAAHAIFIYESFPAEGRMPLRMRLTHGEIDRVDVFRTDVSAAILYPDGSVYDPHGSGGAR